MSNSDDPVQVAYGLCLISTLCSGIFLGIWAPFLVVLICVSMIAGIAGLVNED